MNNIMSYEAFRDIINGLDIPGASLSTKTNIRNFFKAYAKDPNGTNYESYRSKDGFYTTYAKKLLIERGQTPTVYSNAIMKPTTNIDQMWSQLKEALIESCVAIAKEKVNEKVQILEQENKRLHEKLESIQKESIIGTLQRHFNGDIV